jgi:nucleotidyltransferase/DNA polymerase involved in DNA repair
VLQTVDDHSITAYMNDHNMSASDVVSQLRAQVEEKTELTISAGIAPNKMLAKVNNLALTYGQRLISGADLLRQEQAKRPVRDGV